MNLERGNQLYMVGGALLGLALLFAAALWYLDSAEDAAFAAGEIAERGRWQARESEELRLANAALITARARVAQLEREAAAVIADLDAKHLKERDRVQADHDRFMDDLAAGRVRFGLASACQGAAGGAEPGTAAAAGERDGAARAELPAAISRAVARGADLAAEADAVVVELTAAQGVIQAYRKACR